MLARLEGSRALRLTALAAVLLLALGLRLYGIDWDGGGFFHPDERFIILLKLPEIASLWPFDWQRALDPATSPWNPRWFAYGSFPFYLLRLFTDLTHDLVPTLTVDQGRFVGRALSAVADTGTVALVYWLGGRLYGWRTGLLASLFLALAVLHIQLSHFATFDVQLTTWVMVALAGAALAMERPGLRSVTVAGLGLGLGLATKVSVLGLLAPIAVAHLLYLCSEPLGRLGRPRRDRLERSVVCLLATCLVGGAVLLVAQPYTLLDFTTFLKDTREQTQMALRLTDLPYTRQYADTTPYLYQLQQLGNWGLWWPLAIPAVAGLGCALWRAAVGRQRADLLLLAWVAPYFLVTGAFPVKFMRYLLPITPVLLLFGARMLDGWRARAAVAAAGRRVRIAWPAVVIGAVLALTGVYVAAFTNIYRQEHTAVRMAEWLRTNVPPGTPLAREHWEEGLPHLEGYPQEELPLYEPDDPGKVDRLAALLAHSEYVLFFSDRLYGTIPRLPQRYPMGSQYYRMLFSGELGYHLAHAEAAYPSLFGLTWANDTFARTTLPRPLDPAPPGAVVVQRGHADESFSVYDHPLELAFKNDHSLTEVEYRRLLSPYLPAAPGRAPEGLLLTPEQRTVQQVGGTWSAIFDRDGWTNRLPVLAWLAMVEVLGLAALPWCLWLFRRFPDHGAGLAPVLGIVVAGWAAWFAASVGLATFDRGEIAVVIAVLGLLSLGGLAVWRREALAELRAGWWGLLLGHAVFLAAFGLDLFIRLNNPDLWHSARGGEKPMDFAYFNAIIRSTTMPPYDPWYAGGYLNYYYFGQFLAAMLTKLTGVVPSVAYNLAVPTFFACLVGGAFSVGGAAAASIGGALSPRWGLWRLTSDAARSVRGRLAPERWVAGWWPAAGLTVALAVVVAGNLDGAAQLVDRLRTAGNASVPSTLPAVEGTLEALVGVERVVTGARLAPLDYWRPRGMGDMDKTFLDPGSSNPSPTIVEFPAFTYLFADLHAHLIALPIALLVLALALRVVLGGERDRWWQRGACLAVTGLVLGALRWTNSWDYPTYLVVTAAAVGAGEVWRGGLTWPSVGRALLQCGVLVAASLAWFWPFQAAYKLFYDGGLEPAPEHTTLTLYLRIHGLFLAALAAMVAYQVWRWLDSNGVRRMLAILVVAPSVGRALQRVRRLARRAYTSALAVAWGLALVLALAVGGGLLFGTAVPLILALGIGMAVLLVAEVRNCSEGPVYLLMLALAGLGLALSLLVEVVKLDVPGEVARMNNVFKFYLQVWVLFAVAAGYAFWWLLARVALPGRVVTVTAQSWLWGMGVLAAAAMVYPIMATPVRINDRFFRTDLTLDGTDYMKAAIYTDPGGPVELRWDLDAMRWMEDNLQGSPTVLEAITPLYRWGGRVSVYTGLPTVLGWDWHQSQQRWAYRDQIEQRKGDVARLYSMPDETPTLELLHRYGVKYVYLGTLERLYYPPEGINKFAQMARRGTLREAYTNQRVTVYEVVG